MKKKLLISGLIILTVALGFLREYIFETLNHIIEAGADAGGNFSLLKWVFTFVFSILYLILTGCFLQLLFHSGKYIRLAIFVYAVLFGVSFLVLSAGYVFTSFNNVYAFTRTVMGIAQSPIVLIILIPACFLNEVIRRSGNVNN